MEERKERKEDMEPFPFLSLAVVQVWVVQLALVAFRSHSVHHGVAAWSNKHVWFPFADSSFVFGP